MILQESDEFDPRIFQLTKAAIGTGFTSERKNLDSQGALHLLERESSPWRCWTLAPEGPHIPGPGSAGTQTEAGRRSCPRQ